APGVRSPTGRLNAAIRATRGMRVPLARPAASECILRAPPSRRGIRWHDLRMPDYETSDGDAEPWSNDAEAVPQRILPRTESHCEAGPERRSGRGERTAPRPPRSDMAPRLHGMDWPLFDLRLSIGEVARRPVTDADLPAIDAMFPDDDEQDPRWEHFAGLSAQRNRHRLLVQRTWHH